MKALRGLLGLLLSLGVVGAVHAQAPVLPQNGPYADFAELMSYLQKHPYYRNITAPPVIYREQDYKTSTGEFAYTIRLAGHSLGLRHQIVRLTNPFSSRDSLLAHLVVYQQHLVALFVPGYFACYRLPDLQRDEALEKQLNTEKFSRYWVFNQQLIGWRQGGACCFDSVCHGWQPCRQPFPTQDVPKIFEDERFVCRMDCQGEFGGHLYFYDKATHLTHYMPATCATSVWQQDGYYHVLASLAHMSGSASEGIIVAPKKLPLVTAHLNSRKDWQYSFPTSIPDHNISRAFDFIGLTMLGAFRWHDQTLYLVNWRRVVFLATIADSQITIVDPLFSAVLGSEATTVAYAGGVILTTLPDYKHSDTQKESACLLFQGQQVTKVEWGKPR